MPRTTISVILAVTAVTSFAAAQTVHADTLDGALAQAYRNNPQLNAQRATVRSIDEGVPQALSGYRPTISATASAGVQWLDSVTRTNPSTTRPLKPPATVSPSDPATYTESSGQNAPRSYGATATQTLFNGLQTANRTRQAESQVFSARETLRVIEQTVLLDAVTSYMNLLRDGAIFELQKRNVEVLQEQLRQTRDRFNVGEVTRTDVAQSEAALAGGQSSMLTAQANYTTSRAAYRRVIGVDPGKLAAGTPVDRLSPKSLDLAVAQGQVENPSVMAAQYGVDVAALQVKISEGALYPTLTVTGSITQSYESSLSTIQSLTGSVIGQVTVPIYRGGAEYATIRQGKENVGQARLTLALNRDQARANVVQSWGQLDAARAQIDATQSQVNASEIALNGVREEARVGQRTTLDVLNAQQALVNARVSLVTAQRDRVVASYTLLSSVGRLSVKVLGLNVPLYDPMVHYQQVRDAWIGVRTPDGR